MRAGMLSCRILAWSMTLTACGAEYAPFEEEIFDGGDEGLEAEGGAFTGAGGNVSANGGARIVSAPPRIVRVSATAAESAGATAGAPAEAASPTPRTQAES